jgi:hypothetical protein
MERLDEILEVFEEKLTAVRAMIDAYEEGMDYASHCVLEGFAEGLAFAMEEVRARLH